MMAADLHRTSVCRALFDRPSRDDEFSQINRQLEATAARQFEEKWNFDTTKERDDDFIDGPRVKWIKIKSASDSDIPDFYSRGFSHPCRRRALRTCVGKSLSFSEADERGLRASSPVQCTSPSSVDVFLGVRVPVQAQHEPVTPVTSEHSDSATSTTNITTDAVTLDGDRVAAVSSVHSHPEQATPSPVRLGRSLTQTTLTDVWPIRKRARTLSPGRQLFTKRERL